MLETSWKVDIFHMSESVGLISADLATQTALKLSLVFPFSDFLGVFIQVNSYITFPIVLYITKLHLQCSQVCINQRLQWPIFSSEFLPKF